MKQWGNHLNYIISGNFHKRSKKLVWVIQHVSTTKPPGLPRHQGNLVTTRIPGQNNQSSSIAASTSFLFSFIRQMLAENCCGQNFHQHKDNIKMTPDSYDYLATSKKLSTHRSCDWMQKSVSKKELWPTSEKQVEWQLELEGGDICPLQIFQSTTLDQIDEETWIA